MKKGKRRWFVVMLGLSVSLIAVFTLLKRSSVSGN